MTSRKSTFWRWPLTEKCTLCGRRDRRGTLSVGPHAKAHSACGQPPRVRLSVRVCSQSALFRRMRLFSPGQMSRCLTQKRTLSPSSHGKVHSEPVVSRKSAFWVTSLPTPARRLTERRALARRLPQSSVTPPYANGATTPRYGHLESSVLLVLLGRAERYTRTSEGSLRSSSPT